MSATVKSAAGHSGVSRRQLLATAGVGALALAAGGRRAFADDATLKIGSSVPAPALSAASVKVMVTYSTPHAVRLPRASRPAAKIIRSPSLIRTPSPIRP